MGCPFRIASHGIIIHDVELYAGDLIIDLVGGHTPLRKPHAARINLTLTKNELNHGHPFFLSLLVTKALKKVRVCVRGARAGGGGRVHSIGVRATRRVTAPRSTALHVRLCHHHRHPIQIGLLGIVTDVVNQVAHAGGKTMSPLHLLNIINDKMGGMLFHGDRD